MYFLRKYKKIVNIKVQNVPFCINNFEFDFNDNSYNYNLLELCFNCPYSENCKWWINKLDYQNIKPFKSIKSEIYKKTTIEALKKIYLFLLDIWYKETQIVITSQFWVLYYYLFENYNMFFNELSGKYFMLSDNKRIFISLHNKKLNSNYFINEGKNLIFGNNKLLQQYIDLMKFTTFDIIFYSWHILDKKIKTLDYWKLKFNFQLSYEINFNRIFDYNRIEPNYQILNYPFKQNYSWIKKQNYSWLKKQVLKAINIAKWDFIYDTIPADFVLISNDITPKNLDLIIKASCILLERKTEISHWAIMSRELKKDCIYWIDWIVDWINSWDILEIDFDSLEINIIK